MKRRGNNHIFYTELYRRYMTRRYYLWYSVKKKKDATRKRYTQQKDLHIIARAMQKDTESPKIQDKGYYWSRHMANRNERIPPILASE